MESGERTLKFHGRKVLQEFVKAGAPEEILYVSKPHIGTFRLVGVVEKMRKEIIELGGEVRFSQKVTGFEIIQSYTSKAFIWRAAIF